MPKWTKENLLKDSFQKLSGYYYHLSVWFLCFHKKAFGMKQADVKKIPVFEDDQIDWNLTEAEVWEHYDFTFQQNFDVNAAGPEINGDELIFHDDPGLYSAVCFYLNSFTGGLSLKPRKFC